MSLSHEKRQTLEVRVMSLYLLHCLYSYLPIQQNPFLCLFVDIYNLASQDDKLRSERFVTSVILNGRGEEVRTGDTISMDSMGHIGMRGWIPISFTYLTQCLMCAEHDKKKTWRRQDTGTNVLKEDSISLITLCLLLLLDVFVSWHPGHPPS